VSPYKTKGIKQSLLQKGFRQSNTHHEMFYLFVNNKKTSIRTRLSHGISEYGDNLLGQMARQLKLERIKFEEFIECPLTEKEYLAIVANKGLIKL
jgi:hypothetical protein